MSSFQDFKTITLRKKAKGVPRNSVELQDRERVCIPARNSFKSRPQGYCER